MSLSTTAQADPVRLSLVPFGSGTADLSVVIVTYNVRELLAACLASLYANHGPLAVEVCVVDNASQDGSAAMVRERFPDVTVLAHGENRGYAHANNLALARARGRHVLLLNPDTVLPPDGLRQLVRALDDDPTLGAVGPKLIRPDGSLDLACRRSFPTPEIALYRMLGLSRRFPRSRRFARYNLTYLDPDEPADVDALVGACMAIRGSALQQVGLLDERFFMYGEDLDLAYRLKQHGWRVRYDPSIVVLHHKGASSRQASLRARRAFFAAMLLFHRKHYWQRHSPLVNALVVAGIAVWAGLSLAQTAARQFLCSGR
jgi:GT2 family glycosyltransferase